MLTTLPLSEHFDLSPWVGQRSASFEFRRINGLTGEHLSSITPLRTAQLTHNTQQTIKRQLTLNLGVEDTAAIDPIVDRIELYMNAAGQSYPLGRYMFTDMSEELYTSGSVANCTLSDEMFLVDQEILRGISGVGFGITSVIGIVTDKLPVITQLEPTPYTSHQSWSAGSGRGQILQDLATAGDYFSPWFANNKKLRFIRTFDPAKAIPQFDYDAGNQVIRAGIVNSSNLLTAPNRFIVISNTSAIDSAVVGTFDVPPAFPYSFQNRGFYVVSTVDMQLSDVAQAQAVAQGLSQRGAVFETVQLSTPLDPRHDSYDVIHWQGDLWLELGWTMQLNAAGVMQHSLRKAYQS